MSGRWLWSTAVIGALLVTYTLLTRRVDDAGTSVARPTLPGYYLEDAVIVETGLDGQPRVRLAARAIAQNSEDDSIKLTDVRVDYTGDTARHWVLTAKHGYVPPNARRIRFDGDVQIQEITSDAAPKAMTERLELDMDKNIARTDAPVKIVYGPHTLSAQGLWADLKGETLRLESNVNGQFVPH
jgi:LPS export ABC transporter protein LptC